MPENVLYVAGATGYIGREVVKRALKRGYTVHASVRPNSETALPPHDRLIFDVIQTERDKTAFNIPTAHQYFLYFQQNRNSQGCTQH